MWAFTEFNTRTTARVRRIHLFGLALALVVGARTVPSAATHLNIPDVPGFRTPLPNEGYLKYKANPVTLVPGEEWTGWVDIRHPSLAGVNDTDLGYDRSDRSVSIRTTILTDNTAPAAGSTAPSDRPADFDCANKAYMLQSGLSLIETANRNVVSPPVGMPNSFRFGAPSFTFPVERNIMALNNGPVPTFEVYYATSLNSGNFAETYSPSIGGAANNVGMFIANVNSNGTCDTFAHEFFHFVADSQPVVASPPGDPGHSNDPRNVVAAGAIQLSPGMNQNAIGAGNPPWNIPNSTSVIGPNLATADGTPNGAPRIGGFDQIVRSQASRIFDPNVGPLPSGLPPNGAAPYIAKGHNDLAADRVDWDFVTDNRQITDLNGKTFGLEGLTNGADNHGNNLDSLYFEIPGVTPTQPSPQAGKVKTGLGEFPATADFAGPAFHFVDVFSLGLRYSDSDFNAAPNLSLREKTLDYDLFCRAADGTTMAGVPLFDFIGGWTGTSFADDYLARWRCDNDATGVFIFDHLGDRHDGLAQIDAVIVSGTPEPASLSLLLAGAVIVFRRRLAA